MGTRSFIAYKNGEYVNSPYNGVYCHWDGYPEGVGKVLREHYSEPNKIKTLITKGGMSSLHPEIEKTEFYTKRGEPLQVIKTPNIQTLIREARNLGCQYLYRFEKDSWSYHKLY